jgi:hypothetical protein
MSCAFALHFQILTFLPMILICVCSYGLKHMMVNLLLLDATNQEGFCCMTQKIFHPRFLSLFYFQLLITTVLLVLPPLALVFILFVLLMHPSFHHILK